MSESFDREFGLDELLPAPLRDALGGPLGQLLGVPPALLDAAGQPLWGTIAPTAARYALAVELEPLGWLVTPAPPDLAAAAAGLLLEFLRLRRRYLMASYLHTEAVTADYAEMQKQNAALTESEARYRELAGELDARVKAQAIALEHSQRQLYQAEKLASVAQLAAGIAHEINNPIGFVRSNLSSLSRYLLQIAGLRERLADASTAWREMDLDFVMADGAELVNDCIAGIDRVARIVADLKGFSNVDRPEEAIVDINEGLRTACAVIETKKPPEVRLVLDTGQLPTLLCLPGHLNQVFLNVLTNAMQAVGAQGEIRVESRLEQVGETQRIVVRIRDNGAGIDASDLPKVFDPFFTTRPVGQGTGLGLTVARDIVQIHEGTLEIDSTPGQGTLVTIRLPL